MYNINKILVIMFVGHVNWFEGYMFFEYIYNKNIIMINDWLFFFSSDWLNQSSIK